MLVTALLAAALLVSLWQVRGVDFSLPFAAIALICRWSAQPAGRLTEMARPAGNWSWRHWIISLNI